MSLAPRAGSRRRWYRPIRIIGGSGTGRERGERQQSSQHHNQAVEHLSLHFVDAQRPRPPHLASVLARSPGCGTHAKRQWEIEVMRTGADYLSSLNDGRRVFLDGEAVKDVSAHPAFREAARLDRWPLRHRRRSGQPRAHDVSLAEDRRAGAARLADSEDPCRFTRTAFVLGNLGGGDFRPDGPRARPRRRLFHRLMRRCRSFSPAPASKNSPRISPRSTNSCATTTSIAPTPSCRRRSTARSRAPAERPDALCRRSQGTRRRHRHYRRAAACHRPARSPITSI